ncbi:MAG: hypothetical protein R6V58_04240, partial [Planctomycetota bacterium]
MQARTVVLHFLLIVLLAGACAADVLELSHGGKLKGQLKRVTFFAGGEEKAFARGVIGGFRLAKAGKDELTLKDGTVLEGEFVKLAFRSVGG